MPAVLVNLNPKSSGSWLIKRTDKVATPDGACLWVLLGAFAKLWKATASSCLSVRPSVRMERLSCHWTDFHEILRFSICRKSVEEIQVSLNSDKNVWHLIWRPDWCSFVVINRSVRPVSDTGCTDCHITHFTFNNSIPFFRNHAVYEITCKNIVERGRPQMAMW
jgi:hypothetical protein